MSDVLKFHSFPDLATELRLKVWNEAIPSPRVILVFLEVEGFGKEILRFATYDQDPDIVSDEATPSIPSSLLHVNFESRELILSSYDLAFDGVSSTPLYIDWSRDTLYFFFWYSLLGVQRLCEDEEHRRNTEIKQLSDEKEKEVMEKRKAWMNQVQFIKIALGKDHQKFYNCFTKLPNLKRVTIKDLDVMGYDNEEEEEDIEQKEIKVKEGIENAWREAFGDEKDAPMVLFIYDD